MDSSRNTTEASQPDPATETIPAQEVEVMVEDDRTGSEAAAGEGETERSDPAEALTRALDKLKEAEERSEAAHQSYLRAVADLDNYRKRMQRERANIASQTAGRTVGSLLPVLDSFDAALNLEASSEQEQHVLSGMRATYDLLLGTLENQGLEIIATDDEEFSPELHEPINAPPPGDGALMVANEVRRGYRLRGRLLRAALVTVTRGGESE